MLPALAPGLYVVATPIGNLEDLSARAVRVLKTAERVACEDTRVSRHLLQRVGARGHCVALHAHNEARRSPELLQAIAEGARIALISDAGTPAVSDPGARLVAAAHARGLAVVPIPGASAVTTLISAAGLGDGRFRFEGFLPARAGQRRARLLDLATSDVAVVLFEAPHRIEALARDLSAILEPGRRLVIGRELTKRFEQIAALTAGGISDWLAADPDRRRGEFVVAIEAGNGASHADSGFEGGGLAEGEGQADGEGLAEGEGQVADEGRGEGVGRVAAEQPPANAPGPTPLGRKAVTILADKLPPREAARLAARISGDDADLLYRFRAGQRSRA